MVYLYWLIALSFLVITHTASADNGKSLDELVSAAKKSDKSSACLDVCAYLVESGEVSDLFIQYLEKGYRAALRERNAETIARYYDCKAECLLLLGELEDYPEYKNKAFIIYEKLGRQADMANCCIYFGNYFNAVGEYDSARIYLTKMQSYARRHYKESSYNIMLSCLADTYYRMGEKDSAIHYEVLSAGVSTALCDTFYLLSSYRALGMYYRTKGVMDSALVYYEKALNLSLSRSGNTSSEMEEMTSLYASIAMVCLDTGRSEEACSYLLKATESICNVKNEVFLAQAYSNIGAAFLKVGKLAEATLYIKRGIQLSAKLGMDDNYLRGVSYHIKLLQNAGYPDSIPYYIVEAEDRIPHVRATMAKVSYYQALVEYWMGVKDYRRALEISGRILQLKDIQTSKFIMQELYDNMRVCYYHVGDYKAAYESLNRAIALRDSTFYGEKSKELQELALKYRTKEKELEIVRLNAQKERMEEQARLRIFILISCLVISSLVFLAVVQRQKMKSERMKRASEEREREFAGLKKDTELRLARKYIDGLETERGRLAKELHDGVSNDLLALEVKLKPLLGGKDFSVFSFLSQTRENVRNISHELMPPAFRYATIDEMLWDYVNHQTAPASLKLCYNSDPEGADWSIIPEDIGYEVYRIVQEALSNSIKYAAATVARVSLELDGMSLIVRVMDNGDGFDVNIRHKGIGLQTMKERAAAIGGELSVESDATGTKIRLIVPISAVR